MEKDSDISFAFVSLELKKRDCSRLRKDIEYQSVSHSFEQTVDSPKDTESDLSSLGASGIMEVQLERSHLARRYPIKFDSCSSRSPSSSPSSQKVGSSFFRGRNKSASPSSSFETRYSERYNATEEITVPPGSSMNKGRNSAPAPNPRSSSRNLNLKNGRRTSMTQTDESSFHSGYFYGRDQRYSSSSPSSYPKTRARKFNENIICNRTRVLKNGSDFEAGHPKSSSGTGEYHSYYIQPSWNERSKTYQSFGPKYDVSGRSHSTTSMSSRCVPKPFSYEQGTSNLLQPRGRSLSPTGQSGMTIPFSTRLVKSADKSMKIPRRSDSPILPDSVKTIEQLDELALEKSSSNAPMPPKRSVSPHYSTHSLRSLSPTREKIDQALATLRSSPLANPTPSVSNGNRPIYADKTCGKMSSNGGIPLLAQSSPKVERKSESERLTSFMTPVPMEMVQNEGERQTATVLNDTPQYSHFVVVAIDFGTTYSGYAFSFTHDTDTVHIMRKWEGDDPGMNNQKTPTILLLNPNKQFHSFGFSARDFYHDLVPDEAKKWYFFDKFKMILHHNKKIDRSTKVKAANGAELSALDVFSHTLKYFKDHALKELSDTMGSKVVMDDVRWVVTVPAIWRQQAKQFMRESAYAAGIGSPKIPDQVLIALEPEAASIYCRKLRLNQLMPERPKSIFYDHQDPDKVSMSSDFVLEETGAGGRYMVVDCGGGTVDITVHEITNKEGQLKELFKATGGPYGSTSVDEAFEELLGEVLGQDLLAQFKKKRPMGYIDLMIAFESRKRSCSPYKMTPLNVALPFSLIDFYKRQKGKDIGSAVNKFGHRGISWASHGMIRIDVKTMRQLFQAPIEKIKEHISRILDDKSFAQAEDIRNVDALNCAGIGHLFLVGGFSESALVQEEIRSAFRGKINVIIPQGVSVAVLRGAVLYGLDPSIVHVRRAMKTYGIGIIKPFIKGKHPKEKMVHQDGQNWCLDIFDKFVVAGQSVNLGEAVLRRYRPVNLEHNHIVLGIYSSDFEDREFITDPGVEQCGSMSMKLEHNQTHTRMGANTIREIQAKMLFGDTEIKATALDVQTKQMVKVNVDFLNESNPKYQTHF